MPVLSARQAEEIVIEVQGLLGQPQLRKRLFQRVEHLHVMGHAVGQAAIVAHQAAREQIARLGTAHRAREVGVEAAARGRPVQLL